MFKRCKVVMLPTNEKAIEIGQISMKSLLIDNTLTGYHNIEDPVGFLCVSKRHFDHINRHWTGQHLYILSDDEIKEGDLIFNTLNNCIARVYFNESKNDAFKKVIATTDSSLKFADHVISLLDERKLPSPSQSFIQKFVEEYNKGNKIEEVMVEYEEIPNNSWGFNLDEPINLGFQLKVNPKDNTITIRKIKNSFTMDRVKQLAWFAVQYAAKLEAGGKRIIHRDEIDTFLDNEMSDE